MLGLGDAPHAFAAGSLSQGGNAGIAAVNSSVTATLAAEQQANTVAVQAQNQLSRVTTALQAMQTMQTAARNLALGVPSTVPDGLQIGGLVPQATGLASPGVANPVSSANFVGAQTPTQAVAAGKTTVTINQTAAQALLSWNSFNVGTNTTVDFNQQGHTTWTALNTIDAGSKPSQILGSIQASGHVYLIDPNGIIFGGASQIDVGALVASSAGITDSQFLTNGIYSGADAPSFTGAGGPIKVEPGAQITTNTPADVTTGGGYVLLMGTQVVNGGTISTPVGQTELAAGDDFYIRAGYSTDGTTANQVSTTRGNEIAMQLDKPGSSLQPRGSGLVENTGEISAATGDITLAGETVVQNGVAVATTSVAVRGTIHLLSSASDKFSSVTLGPNAYTMVEPDLSSTDTALDSQRAALIADSATANGERTAATLGAQFDDLSLLDDQQEDSRIEIVTGGTAHFENGSDSSAPGGQLAISAALRVQVDNGALLDASGSYGVAMSMASNDIAVNIQNNQLRDDPQNRLTQDLRSATVNVDARTVSVVPASAADTTERDYTAGGLLEVSGYLANVGHTIGEFTALGGGIDLSTGKNGAIVSQTGSVFDIDGGTLQYQAGELPQSYLVGSDGRIYNVNTAPSDITYTGVFGGYSVDHPAWGVTQTYANVLDAPSQIFEAGYVVGRDAGSLTLSSPTTIFDGAIDAAAANGPAQIAADPSTVTDPYLLTQSEVAQPGALFIESVSAGAVGAIDTDVVFGAAKVAAPGVSAKIKARYRGETLIAAATLIKAGLGSIEVITTGNGNAARRAVNGSGTEPVRSIVVAAPLAVAPGGTVDLYGAGVDIAANITAAGGSVTAGEVVTIGGTPTTLKLPGARAGVATGNTVVGKRVVISTAGLWTNLVTNPTITFTQAYSNGGAVDLTSVNDLTLDAGSAIDTQAGGTVSATGVVTGGAGGNTTLEAGNIATAVATNSGIAPNPRGILTLDASLDAMGATHGGTLTLGAPEFLITAAPDPKANKKTLVLDPAFFTQGFSAYNLFSTGNITVAGHTIIAVTEPVFQADKGAASRHTGAAADAVFIPALEPIYTPNKTYTAITQRPGASFSAEIVSLTAQSTPSVLGNTTLKIDRGAVITVDPGQSIALAAPGQIDIDGRLNAPGGSISAVSSFNSQAALTNGPGTVSVFVGTKASLNADAKAVSFQNAAGRRIAVAPAGGSITLGSATSTASVIINARASIAASGSSASDQIVASAVSPVGAVQPAVPIAGAGGTISLASAEGIYNDGTLAAAAGAPSAAGGTLAITLEADEVLNSGGTEATPRILTISQTDPGPVIPPHLKPGTSTGLTIGTAAISADAITAGGFGTVTLYSRDAFLFQGDVTLSATQSISLEQGVITDSSPAASVTLNAPYVTLSGQTPDTNVNASTIAVISGFSAQTATGAFTVNAALIDLQNAIRFGGILPAAGTGTAADLAGFATVDLNSSGDLQFEAAHDPGNGSAQTNIITTADLNLSAREIYAIGDTGTQVASVTAAAPAAVIIAGYDPTGSGANGSFNPAGAIDITAAPGTTAVAPDTLFGALTFEAATIDQGGVVWQPLGQISFGNIAGTTASSIAIGGDQDTAVNFLPGSLTSVSAAGLAIPFGGTTDGVNYAVDAQAVQATTIVKFGLQTVTNGASTGSIAIQALNTNVEAGASIGLQGGGTLSGAGFISGEGGSTDVLATPLLNVSSAGVSQPSLSTDPVYAIVAGAQPTEAVAYTQTGATGSTPATGRQIVVPAGIPGLPAGTYTLLPAAYALEPGGYRVEFDGTAALNAASVTALPDGSYAVAGYTALAGTALRGSLASNLTITPGATVLNYSQYDQEAYSAFLQATAASIGAVRPVLPADAGTLVLNLPISSAVSVVDAGTVSFAAAAGGNGGVLQISGNNISGAEPDIDIYGAAPATGLPANTVSLSGAQIDAFDPAILEIGVAGAGGGARVNSITLEDGATLRAARVVLTALSSGITLDGGSGINTIGRANLLVDSTTEGLLSNDGATVLDVGNGYLVYGTAPVFGSKYGPITVADGAEIYTDGSIAFSTSNAVNIGVGASYGGRYLDLAVPEINIGDPQAAGATAPAGVLLTQAVLQNLTAGIPAADVPAVQILNLTAFDSLNLYGTTALDLTGSNVQLEINTPAIYGFGSAADVATIGASTIVWNGISTTEADGTTIISSLPGGTIAGGAGSGSGTLDLNARTIILGYSDLDVPQRDATLTRLTAGFSNVNLNASSEITANNDSSLAVYQAVPNYGQAGTGGTLNLNTPLLTTADAASIGFTAGSAINVGPATGTGAASLATEAAGGEIDLAAGSIGITGSVILPSGKLDLQAAGDIKLGTGSLLDLAGVTTTNVDQKVYGFGGAVILASANGNITQDAGSVIDVSATNNAAGSIDVTATATAAGAGQVALNGTLKGSVTAAGSASDTAGLFEISAQSLGDFAALNTSLNAGGFFQTRDFDIGQGDLTIGDGVKAHNVSVSLDHGSLTVTGLIDASGQGGGSISLAAADNLTLAATGVLDAHGDVLRTDSYGVAIAAENQPVVSLTASGGALTLDPNAAIDLVSADGVARGDLELNVPRLGGNTSGDADISAPGAVSITGAASIAVNAFATYTGLVDPNPTVTGASDALITQAYLDQIDTTDTQPFMTAAATNADLAVRLAGLSAYGAAFHFRPGVAIVSATDLTVQDDIDLAGYRYGPGVIAGDVGSGEPGVLQIRAGGNLNVYGSITDGFEQPIDDKGTEFAGGWVIYGGEPYNQNQTVPTAIGIATGSAFADTATVNFAVPIDAGSFAADAVAPVALTTTVSTTTTIAFVATSSIVSADGTIKVGQYVPAGTVIPAGAVIGAGGTLPFAIAVGPVTWPANTPFTVTTAISSGGTGVVTSAPMTLLPGSLIPASSALIFQSGDPGLQHAASGDLASVDTRPVGADGQGQLYGLASQLPAGDLSWSIDLVSGADTKAASPDAVQTASALAQAGSAGNLTLADTHYGISGTTVVPAFSVVRTGTGSLNLVSGGSIDENSAFGVYTAGAESPAIVDQASYDLPQGSQVPKTAALSALVANYTANYPTGGGNVLVSAQNDLNGFISTEGAPNSDFKNAQIADTDAIGAWLWRQGGAGNAASWWVEYGSLNVPAKGSPAQYTGFQGIGTLGGGNLSVKVGGTAKSLDLVVASNGRIQSDGTLLQNGGGALDVTIGGTVNYGEAGAVNLGNIQDAGGVISDLRGTTKISAGSIGTILPQYGSLAAGDIRFLSPFDTETETLGNGIDLAPGDSTVTVDTRGDLAIASVDDPGIVQNYTNTVPVTATAGGSSAAGQGVTDFTLWTAATGISLFSAGGDVVPAESAGSSASQNDTLQHLYPANLMAAAQNGDIYFGTQAVELSPSADGELELLAADSIIGDASIVSMSGAALSVVATPFDPGIVVFNTKGSTIYTNHSPQTAGDPIDFGPDTPTGALHADDAQPARIYAATGDILDIEFGRIAAATTTEVQVVQAAKPFDIFAGRDIVDSGSILDPDIFLNLSGSQISTVTAGRDIIESSFDIAGPGQLVVQAGRNYEALDQGVIDSIGPISDIDPSNRDDGAAVSVLAGVGTAGPDYSGFANQFLNPASTLDIVNTNGDNIGSTVVQNDDALLYGYLQTEFGYMGSEADAYATFLTLPAGDQAVLLRSIYFSLLNTSGLLYNEQGNSLGLYKTYILGRDTIAALFPATYDGSITMYGSSGIHTDFGGDIETLTPGGATTVGVEGTTPPASAGILTQGNGDIDIYAEGSVELGESRVLTTFGGNILVWSAAGDINAGRGSKTTIDFTPLQRLYDNYGDVFLSPSVPSSGAGIGTLAPIPSVAAGDINLIAPLGTIDAGEAGIRSSGNTNLVAIVVLNGNNISTKGSTTTSSPSVSPNVGALTSTSNAAGAAAQAAEGSTGRTQATPLPSIWIVEILGYGGGEENSPPPEDQKKKKKPQTQAI